MADPKVLAGVSDDALNYLLGPQAIRDRTQQLFELCEADRLDNFRCDRTRLDTVTDFVLDTIQQNYPDFEVPFHSRWRHFDVGGVNRLPQLDQALAELSSDERAKAKLDLAIVSVLLDAGAGRQWQYRDDAAGQTLTRSEGLAIASFNAFMQGAFSSDADYPYQVDAQALQQLTEAALADVFQVSDQNPLVGLVGRLSLLQALGKALMDQPERFGSGVPRPGNLLDGLKRRYPQQLDAGNLLREVLRGFGAIWPGRVTLNGVNLGDVWSHPSLSDGSAGTNLVPFHKLSQWLTYSLVEPLVSAGVSVVNLDALTGLAEYRNGGLLVDLGFLVPKHPDVIQQPHRPGSTVVVEWRALTVVGLDHIADSIRHRLNKTAKELPLIKILEGGTWAAGRRIAKQHRPDGTPPISLQSDGTVF
ncbi:MAG: URC4/urg3 family protein [Cyanobacteria bacterium J06632_22]